MLDHRALAVALRARGLDSHDAGRLNHSALAAAIAAHFAAAAFGGAGAFACGAMFVALEFDGFRDAVGGFFERERDVAANIAALASLVALAAAEQVAEQIAECGEDVFDVGEVVGAELAVEAGVAVAIVAAALVGVVEHFERFGRFLEALDGFLVARVFVRVILYGQLAIRRRDLAVRGGSLDAEDFVIVALRGHCCRWASSASAVTERVIEIQRLLATLLTCCHGSSQRPTHSFYASGPLAQMAKWPAAAVNLYSIADYRMLPTTAFLLSSLSKFVTRASVVSISPAMLAALREGGLARPSSGR